MTPNKHSQQRHRMPTVPTVPTKRDAESRAKASRIDHNGIATVIANTQRHDGETFSLRLEGSALAPGLHDGDLLTISSTTSPLPGDAVVVRIDGRFGCMRINADGDLWDAFGGFVPAGSYTIAGVVLERRSGGQ